MNTPIRLFLILMFVLAARASALEWTSKSAALSAGSETKEVRTTYTFKNTTKGTVHIVDLTTSCGCTVATTESPEIAAGATGTIKVVFTIGQRSGLQEKRIFVQTDESPDPVTLDLKVQLPDAASATVKSD